MTNTKNERVSLQDYGKKSSLPHGSGNGVESLTASPQEPPESGIPPVFAPDVPAIVFACDNRYALFVGVAVQNIILLSSAEEQYDIIVLETLIDAERKEAIARLADGRKNISIRFFSIAKELERHGADNIPIAPRFTKEVFAPLFIPHLCRRYHKALSIDPDILITSDIAELLKTDLTGYMLGAVVDFECVVECLNGETPYLDYRDYIKERLNIPFLDFFNSGVVLFNISGMIEEGTLPCCVESIAYAIRLPDQDALNWAAKGRVLYLDPIWNVQMFCYMKQNFNRLPASVQQYFNGIRSRGNVLHFTFVFKPWFHEGYAAWWSVARRTEFYDIIKREFLLNKDVNPLVRKAEEVKPKRVTVRLAKDG